MRKKDLTWSLNPMDAFKTIGYKFRFMRNNPDYFKPHGVSCFCGEQGAGKTYSAVSYVYTLMDRFPKCIVCTNMNLYGLFDKWSDRVLSYEGVDSFSYVNNGTHGVIFLIDELHLEFNSLESRKMPLSLFTEISQQRKQRKHIVGTSQLYSRLAKPFREQMDVVVACKCIGGLLQFNTVFDGWTLRQDEGKLTGVCQKRYCMFHRSEIYDSFDTYEKVNRKKGDFV